jgi:hypothetical protein
VVRENFFCKSCPHFTSLTHLCPHLYNRDHLTDSATVEEIPGGGTASGTAPHADSRSFSFRADGALLQGDDGGINIRTNPLDNTGDWFGVCGNMQNLEAHSVAYESHFGRVLIGTQDNANIFGVLGEPGTFGLNGMGDGNRVFINYESDPDYVYYFYGTQRYTELRNFQVNKTDEDESRGGGRINSFVGPADFLSAVAMNPADQNQFVIAVNPEGEDSATGFYNHLVSEVVVI